MLDKDADDAGVVDDVDDAGVVDDVDVFFVFDFDDDFEEELEVDDLVCVDLLEDDLCFPESDDCDEDEDVLWRRPEEM